jgi:ArsR family transcriptional regulator, arsenate/arsenite/antimonite-responsive transcriptional repressor
LSTKVAAPVKPRTKVSAKGKAKLRISDGTIDDLADVFKLLSDMSRLKILLALAHNGEMHVTALCELLGQSQPAVSHHLTLLRKRLVGYRRDGKHNYYHVDATLIQGLLEQFFHESGNGQKQFQFPGFSLAYRGK